MAKIAVQLGQRELVQPLNRFARPSQKPFPDNIVKLFKIDYLPAASIIELRHQETDFASPSRE